MAQEPWRIEDSIDLYQIAAWGSGFFRVNARGRVEVTPEGPQGPSLDLFDLVEQLRERDMELPLLLRFPGIIKSRIEALCGAFDRAIADEGYRGRYHAVYPIKVNQQRKVVEALLEHGHPRGLGLEAGSKPELLAALALADNPDALLVLNGYKDAEYVETALLATKLGRNSILVIDRYRELDTILKVAKRLGISPRIGVRAQLDARARGKWNESSGPGSKFGLDPDALVRVVERLREIGMLECLVLLHFHAGSQITAIRGLKDAVQEAARVYVELVKMGAPLRYLDVGGGLAVDYDGSNSSSYSSMNYGMQEYANDVVFHVREMCDEKDVPHPDIVSESGRALVAHHSVLILNVPDMDEGLSNTLPEPVHEDDHRIFHTLYEAWKSIRADNLRECWHDVNHARSEAVNLFTHGILDLKDRARVDRLFRACCSKILTVMRGVKRVPAELGGLERRFCDIYFGNFSIFQSAPDHWAVDQLFPIIPIHRLDERPERRGILADLTCDSDGVIDSFIGAEGKSVIELHALNENPYYVGIFLLGAYQEILGDLHNLFGDTNAVHVTVDSKGNAILEHFVEQDTVTEVLGYVGFDRRDLLARIRQAVERSVRSGSLGLRESALFLRDYEKGLSGTTYLEDEDWEARFTEDGNGASPASTLERAPVARAPEAS
jgi:arginine decarboxylase